MPPAMRAPGVPRGGGPGSSAWPGHAGSTSLWSLSPFCHVLHGVWSLFRAALLLSLCIHSSNAREARSLPHVAAGRSDAATVMTRASRPVVQAEEVQRIAPADALALEKLWEGWGRDMGLEEDGWGSPWLCTAEGVECNARGRVSALRLSDKQLEGSLASSIGSLLSLSYLDLGSNQLTGKLPSSIGRMSSLEYLDLNNNQLSGSLPSSIGGMSSLTFLNLARNELTGSLPSGIGEMISLADLNLSVNQLTANLPSSIGALRRLESLDLSFNNLIGTLPSSISGMSSLQFLGLGFTLLSGSLPSWLGQMRSLTSLDLSQNQLTGSLPPWLWGMSGLQSLDLGDNQLTGSLPSRIGRMSSLQTLALSSNQLTGSVPSWLGKMSSLTSLDLSQNQLTGSLPSWLWEMSSLHFLSLSDNQLTGSLPSSIGVLTSLTTLKLGNIHLTGSLPSWLGSMRGLCALDLSRNQLRGNLPSGIRGMSSLDSLDLSLNQLNGSLPSWLGEMESLRNLDLSYNELNGSLPSSIGGLTRLTVLKLRKSRLTGRLPSSLGGMGELQSLDLSFNQLNGSLPSSLGGMRWLTSLDLSRNQLTGNLPSSIGQMIGLYYLDLSDNQLGGGLPTSIFGMRNLISLKLSSNQLTGSLPSSLELMNSLKALDLSSNRLNGILPSNIRRMGSLAQLDLSRNRLSGSLLASIGGMFLLSFLDLSHNAFSGEVPYALSGLWGLSHLDLGHNSKLKASTSSLSGLAGLSRLQHLGLALPRLNAPLAPLRLPLGRLTFLSLQRANVTGTASDFAHDASSTLKSLNLHGTAIQGVLPSGLALLSSLSVMKLPGRVLCPNGPCRNPTVAWNQAFCARCSAFCATCPAASSLRDSHALLQFQADSGNFPGIWTNSSFEGVSLDRNRHVHAISLSSDSIRWARSAHNLRFDILPRATIRTLILLSDYGLVGGTLSTTLSCLSTLKKLDVSQVQDTKVPSLSHLSSLTALDFSGHVLPNNGELPATLVGLQSLSVSSVRKSEIPGSTALTEIPSTLSLFTKLTQLDLSENTIPGRIPRFLSALRLLANLDLSGNQFEGSVPESLSLLGNLTALNLGKNKERLILPSGLATLPLVYLIVDKWNCTKPRGGSPCPPLKVNPSSPFCRRYCRHICDPCYPPTSTPPPRSLPPALPPPSPPPSPASDGNTPIIAGAASAAGLLVLLTAAALWHLLIRKQRRPHDEDDIDKRGVRSLSAEEVEEMTRSFSSFIGGEGVTEMYRGETGQGQGVKVWVRESGRGRDRKAAERAFRKDVWLLSGIHHRYLQELYGYCLTPRKQYLVFESHEQGSLWRLLREDPRSLTWSRRLNIALTAALGLDYLHSQLDPPLVHKDVKSRTILVTAEFEGKVGVAGLGALEFGDEGSLGYADPSKGEQGSPTAKCDVYAFGVMLLELATGLRPLDGEAHILSRVLELTASEDGLQRGMPAEIQGERQQPAQGERTSNGTAITEVDSAPLLTLEAFKCFLELGISCCSFKPQDRPSMAQVLSIIEELLHGKSLPAAPFRAPGQVPFPEYAEPIRGPLSATEILGVSFTMTGNSHGRDTSTSNMDKDNQ